MKKYLLLRREVFILHTLSLFIYLFFINFFFAGDAASDCTTSYYSEYDPFDYLYNCGTQYSDPVYEAVNKLDRNPLSPGKLKLKAKIKIFKSIYRFLFLLITTMNRWSKWMESPTIIIDQLNAEHNCTTTASITSTK